MPGIPRPMSTWRPGWVSGCSLKGSGYIPPWVAPLRASCYRSCLELAAENSLESVAFCCISTGEFHFSNEEAAEIAVKTVKEFLEKDSSVKKVIFNVYKDLDKEIYAFPLLTTKSRRLLK